MPKSPRPSNATPPEEEGLKRKRTSSDGDSSTTSSEGTSASLQALRQQNKRLETEVNRLKTKLSEQKEQLSRLMASEKDPKGSYLPEGASHNEYPTGSEGSSEVSDTYEDSEQEVDSEGNIIPPEHILEEFARRRRESQQGGPPPRRLTTESLESHENSDQGAPISRINSTARWARRVSQETGSGERSVSPSKKGRSPK